MGWCPGSCWWRFQSETRPRFPSGSSAGSGVLGASRLTRALPAPRASPAPPTPWSKHPGPAHPRPLHPEPPSSCPPLPGVLSGGAHAPAPAVPRTAPHDDCTHDAYQHDSTAHTTTPRSRTTKTASQWDLPRGCTPGATAPRGRGRRAGLGLGALLFLLVWTGVPGHGHPRLQTPACRVLVSCWVCPSCRHPPPFLPCLGGTRGRTPALSRGSPSAFPASPHQLLHTPMQSWGSRVLNSHLQSQSVSDDLNTPETRGGV